MKIVETISKIKLKNRLIFLFVLVASGLVVVALIGFVHTKNMKLQLDRLYFGSFVHLSELNIMQDSYQSGILNTLSRATRGQIEPSQALLSLDDALKTINKNWHIYTSHYKQEQEREYVEFATKKIQILNESLLVILKKLENGEIEFSKINLSSLDDRVEYVLAIIDKLISYKVDSARVNRLNFLDEYDYTIKKMIFIFGVLVLIVLAAAYYIFKSIQRSQHSLYFATTKLRLAKKELEKITYIDSLTTLYNRRYFNIIYDKELKRAIRAKTYITFMMIDIDFFKQYNDTYGHLDGDRTLREVAIKLKEHLKRPSDYIFRLGGEEFGILLLDTPADNSYDFACMLNESVKSLNIPHGGSKVSNIVSVSVGIASCVADESLDAEVLLRCADDMLYRAKQNGRNRCELTTTIM